eukprot:SAG31_NODE_46218_length_255_cov_0.974359_1_plen_51_part_01
MAGGRPGLKIEFEEQNGWAGGRQDVNIEYRYRCNILVPVYYYEYRWILHKN